jgi:hypothetical protein
VSVKPPSFSDLATTSYGTEGHDGTVMIDPDVLIAEFGDAAAKAGIEGWPCQLRPETWAPLGFDLEDSIAGASSLPFGRLYGR